MKLNGWSRLYIVATAVWLILNLLEVGNDLNVNLENEPCKKENYIKGLYICNLTSRPMTTDEVSSLHDNLNSKLARDGFNSADQAVTNPALLAILNNKHFLCIKDENGVFPVDHSNYLHETHDAKWTLRVERLAFWLLHITISPVVLWFSLLIILRLFSWVKEGFRQA